MSCLSKTFNTSGFHSGTEMHAYRSMGAHIRRRDGKSGVLFTVYAPNARSCAVLTAGASMNFIGRSAYIHLPGGTLFDRWDSDGHIYMTGPAEAAFTGVL